MRNDTSLGQPVIAYLANRYPCSVEPYVGEEIAALRRSGMRVVACTVWPATVEDEPRGATVTVVDWNLFLWVHAIAVCLGNGRKLAGILRRVIRQGNEPWHVRVRALCHILLGAVLALKLRGTRTRHIHVHHGFLGSMVGMVAANLLNIDYSLTLHGSDLLVRPVLLDIKLEKSLLCFTVSDFNRSHILRRYPSIAADKILVQRMGVSVPVTTISRSRRRQPAVGSSFSILVVGRLHPVKDHAFLVRACADLCGSGLEISCLIAGEGPERRRLERLIRSLRLAGHVKLLGHIPNPELTRLYEDADLIVLTSRSEGIPLTLMEAMARGRPVLAPRITGIPELVIDGKTGYLYEPGCMDDFGSQIRAIRQNRNGTAAVGRAARAHVAKFFEKETNLRSFTDSFLVNILGIRETTNADRVLQQV